MLRYKTKAKRLGALCLLAIFLIGMQSVAYAKVVEAIVSVSSMEVRDEPSASGNVIGTLKKGTKVEVHGVNGGVARIIYKGKKGYALLDDMTKVEASTPAPALSPTPSPTKATRSEIIAADSAKVYVKASTKSNVVTTLKKGAKVQVADTNGQWVKLIQDGKECYIRLEAFTATETPAPTPAPTPTPNPSAKPTPVPTVQPTPPATQAPSYETMKQGDRGSDVQTLQRRLEALGHFDGDPAGNYLSITTAAVKRFQSAAKLEVTGVADNKTQRALYSSSAPKSSILSKSYSQGDAGTDIKRLQLRLQTKGFFKGSIDGKYGSSTATSVKLYQRVVGLTETGNANGTTLKSLFSSQAPTRPDGVVPDSTAPAPTATPEPGTTPRPTATPAPATEPAAPSSSKAETVISTAMAQLGKPYIYGKTGPSSFDCSGLTVYAFKQVGVSLSRTAYAQGYNNGTKLTKSQLKRGDIVCFNTIADSDLSDHVGIYLGNNQFIHASSGSRKVVISSLASGYYQRNFSWGRRVL